MCIETLNKLNPNSHIKTIYLHNYFPHDGLPPLVEVVRTGSGINISYEYLTERVVKCCHAAGQIVSVWIDASVT
jgi:hypothetical protein